MKKKEIFIGVDPGTAVTGYGIVEKTDGGLHLIDYGCIRPPLKFKLSVRYKILFEATKELIKKYNPTSMAIETQFVHEKNPQAGIKIGMARGVIVLAATLADIKTFEYTPKSIKLAATGMGGATKQQMQWMIQQHFRLKTLPEPADAADALALAICHSHALETSNLEHF